MLFVCDSLFLVQKFLFIDSFPNNKVNHQKKKTSPTKFVKLFPKQEIENRQKNSSAYDERNYVALRWILVIVIIMIQ